MSGRTEGLVLAQLLLLLLLPLPLTSWTCESHQHCEAQQRWKRAGSARVARRYCVLRARWMGSRMPYCVQYGGKRSNSIYARTAGLEAPSAWEEPVGSRGCCVLVAAEVGTRHRTTGRRSMAGHWGPELIGTAERRWRRGAERLRATGLVEELHPWSVRSAFPSSAASIASASAPFETWMSTSGVALARWVSMFVDAFEASASPSPYTETVPSVVQPDHDQEHSQNQNQPHNSPAPPAPHGAKHAHVPRPQ